MDLDFSDFRRRILTILRGTLASLPNVCLDAVVFAVDVGIGYGDDLATTSAPDRTTRR